jgi:diguanylate cyclase (GGDEF)-like protein
LYGTVHDITERKHAEDKMHYLAMYDVLTGLPNRQLFHQQLEKAVARAHRGGERLAIMFIDLDRFKRINDTLGHATGDMLLREVAARLNRCVRNTDTVGRDGEADLPEGRVARLAGDEFTVTLDALREPQDAARVARRIIADVSRPFMLSGQEVVVTTSIGIAVYPEDGEQAELLLKNADAAMYQAKDLGRNAYQYFAGEMNSAAVERLRLENELRHAQERNQLSLHYQIKVDARDGCIAGVEALLRWQHPDLGRVPPVTFIPIAEDVGLIVSFGEWVLEEACRQIKAWRDAGLPAVPMAINLSSPSFRQPDLAGRVASALRRHGVAPASLCVEATESILMRDADVTMATLKQLRALGVKLSIDDFGTGYSSLSYLRRFPIDQLKIDRSFVNELAQNSDDAAIINAIASLARSLNLDVVAEGVETAEQARLLVQQRCYIMQGYFFSKPVPAEEVTQMMAQGAAFNRRMLAMLGTPFEIDSADS